MSSSSTENPNMLDLLFDSALSQLEGLENPEAFKQIVKKIAEQYVGANGVHPAIAEQYLKDPQRTNSIIEVFSQPLDLPGAAEKKLLDLLPSEIEETMRSSMGMQFAKDLLIAIEETPEVDRPPQFTPDVIAKVRDATSGHQDIDVKGSMQQVAQTIATWFKSYDSDSAELHAISEMVGVSANELHQAFADYDAKSADPQELVRRIEELEAEVKLKAEDKVEGKVMAQTVALWVLLNLAEAAIQTPTQMAISSLISELMTPGAQDRNSRIVTATALKLRDGPGKENKVLEQLPMGKKVAIIRTDDAQSSLPWVRVSAELDAGMIIGWVHKDHITSIK